MISAGLHTVKPRLENQYWSDINKNKPIIIKTTPIKTTTGIKTIL